MSNIKDLMLDKHQKKKTQKPLEWRNAMAFGGSNGLRLTMTDYFKEGFVQNPWKIKLFFTFNFNTQPRVKEVELKAFLHIISLCMFKRKFCPVTLSLNLSLCCPLTPAALNYHKNIIHLICEIGFYDTVSPEIYKR